MSIFRLEKIQVWQDAIASAERQKPKGPPTAGLMEHLGAQYRRTLSRRSRIARDHHITEEKEKEVRGVMTLRDHRIKAGEKDVGLVTRLFGK